ncbi:cyclase family protein [Nocardia alni]|uniref:cyclase family protein n=1 Tax=Nocardia alni TaxID=2815723 RepID=UPI001C21CC1E|nr:cyclase family protein [Nocardia alni]
MAADRIRQTTTGPVDDPAKAIAAYSNRGRWGDDDLLGTLNHLDAAARAHAAGLVRRGTTVSLDSGVGTPLRAGTRWEGPGHLYDDERAWTGRPRRILDRIARTADVFAGRGVLLDVGRWCGDENGELADGFAIHEDHLRAAAEAQGATAEVRRGDIVLVRTGQLARARRVGEWGAYDTGAAPGLSLTTVDWLYRTQIAAIAMDTGGVQVRPPELAEPPLRRIAITTIGMPLGQMWDLETLAADCAGDGVYEFLLVAAPLPITGAVNAPVNPIAMK